MTTKYATFHPGYNDVAPHFERMGEMFGLYEGREEGTAEEAPGDTLGDTPLEEAHSAGTGNG